MQYETKTHKIHTNESTHSEMGLVRENPIQRTVRTAHLSVLMTVHSFSTQYKRKPMYTVLVSAGTSPRRKTEPRQVFNNIN